MGFESPSAPQNNCEILRKEAVSKFNSIGDPKRMLFIAKELGIRTFLQKRPIRDIVVSTLEAMDEEQLKNFLESNSELLARTEDEEGKGGE
jgi:hypothetical protein